MSDPQHHIHRRISARWFEYTVMDSKHLQTRYNNKVLQGGKSFFRMSKDKMIALLLQEEFGVEALKDYLKQCADWDMHKALVQGKSK